MNVTKLHFNEIPQLSTTDKAYTLGDAALQPFYEHSVTIEQFAEVIKNKSFDAEKRQVLADELEKQYATIEASDLTLQNIQKLRQPNCYTIITAHQPNLFTGPLYLIYKIVSAITLVKDLENHYPASQFVPIFWTGGEDHDFEEVNHLNLFGKRFSWDDEQGGSVGLYSVDSLRPTLDAVKEVLGKGEHAQVLSEQLERFYSAAPNYGEAVKGFINWIFAKYGLVIANANTAAFKRQLIPIFKDELLNQTSKPIVEKTANDIAAAGFKKQAHARDINLFYLSQNGRTRIVKEGDKYIVLDTKIEFAEVEILAELEQNPQNFSANVILRPLFQETIFPNLAYIGGGGELAYWLERKSQFEHYNLPFPMLIRRCSVLWIDKTMVKRMNKLGLDAKTLFQDTDKLLKQYVVDNTEEELSLGREQTDLIEVFEQIIRKTNRIDPDMERSVVSQRVQMQKAIEKIEQRLIRAEKKKNETSLEQIRKLKEKMFPKNGLQERSENFLAFYNRYGELFLDVLMAKLNPLDKKFVVIEE
jgi:bacillithiol biosynthesis cysteine-adding enzyme BshC